MEATNTLTIHFGIMSGSISRQLRQQSFKYDKEKVRELQEDMDAIHRLMINDILNGKQVSSANKKLYTRIRKHVKLKNKIN